MNFNQKTETTYSQKCSGSDAIWRYLTTGYEVSKEDITNNRLIVSVYDKNIISSPRLIASGHVSMVPTLSNIGKDTEIYVDFGFDDKKKYLGRMSLFVILSVSIPEEHIVVDPKFTRGYVHVSDIYGYNFNSYGVLSKLNPYVVLKLCEKQEMTIPSEDDKWTPVWEYQDMRFPVTRSQLQTAALQVTVFSKNHLQNNLIGKGEVGIKTLGVEINSNVLLDVNLVNDQGKDSGTLKIRLRVSENIPIIIPPFSKPLHLPDTFVQGIVTIRQIEGFGFKNMEIIGKQDAFLKMTYISSSRNIFEFETPTCLNKGGEVTWNQKEYTFKVSREDLMQHRDLNVEVLDENSILRSGFIGRGLLPIRRLAVLLDQVVEITVTLHDNTGTGICGRLVFIAQMRESTVLSVPSPLPQDFVEGTLRVVRIRTFDLRNRELVGKQDVYIKLYVGKTFEKKTSVQRSAGGDVLWDYLDMDMQVTRDFLVDGQLLLEAWESNDVTRDLLIGSGSISTQCISEIGKDIEISVPVRDKKHRQSGTISVYLRLECPLSNNIEIPDTFTQATMCIRRLSAFGLPKRAGNPYAVLSIRGWEGKTHSQALGVALGSSRNVDWEYLDLRTTITREMLQSESLGIVIMNKNNIRNDTVVGVGEVSIQRSALHIGDKELTQLSCDIFDDKGKSSGRVSTFVELKDHEELDESELKISDGFKIGTLRISKINSFELKNTEVAGLDDPFVEVRFGDWCEITHTISNGGAFVQWEYLDMRCEVTDEDIKNMRMEITVWNENKVTSNRVIGSSSVTLLRPASCIGREAEMQISLMDHRGKYAGKLIMYATITLEDESSSIVPESFVNGDLHIKHINMYSLKSRNLLGKQDPYVVLGLNNYPEHRTTTLQNIGANPSWKYLDFHYTVNLNVLRSEEVLLTIRNEGAIQSSITSDEIIGQATFPIIKCLHSLGKDVELFGTVKDASGTTVGRIVVLANLKKISSPVLETEDSHEAFMGSIVKINKISAVGLKNKELFGEQVIVDNSISALSCTN
jgi:hypothetical protein